MRKKLKWIVMIIGLIFIGLQFTTPAHTNPPFNEAQSAINVNAATCHLLHTRGCIRR